MRAIRRASPSSSPARRPTSAPCLRGWTLATCSPPSGARARATFGRSAPEAPSRTGTVPRGGPSRRARGRPSTRSGVRARAMCGSRARRRRSFAPPAPLHGRTCRRSVTTSSPTTAGCTPSGARAHRTCASAVRPSGVTWSKTRPSLEASRGTCFTPRRPIPEEATWRWSRGSTAGGRRPRCWRSGGPRRAISGCPSTTVTRSRGRGEPSRTASPPLPANRSCGRPSTASRTLRSSRSGARLRTTSGRHELRGRRRRAHDRVAPWSVGERSEGRLGRRRCRDDPALRRSDVDEGDGRVPAGKEAGSQRRVGKRTERRLGRG